MGLYKSIAHGLVWPLGERIAGLPIRKHLERLIESERWTEERLKTHQNDRFRAVVRHAAETVPFYGKLYAEHGVQIDQIQNVEDAPKLPPVTKDMLRAAGESVISGKYRKEDLILKTSSGSTGEPFRYYISKREKAIIWANLIRNWGWADYEFGDRISICAIGALHGALRHPSVSWIEMAMLRQQWIAVEDLSRDVLRSKLERIRKFNPKVMRGYASSLYYLARGAIDTNYRFAVPSAISTSETLTDYMRETITTAFDTTVYDQYGAEGMTIASECEAQSGMHINSESVLLEVVDDQAFKPSDKGEILLTNLEGFAYPFIRYRVMDIAQRGKAGPCACGRTLPRLGGFEGRVVDCFNLANGRFMTVPPFCEAFGKLRDVVTWQIRHVKPDSLRILVQCADGVLSEESRTYMEKETRQYAGEGISFDVVVVNDIPATNAGKRRYFVSEIDDDTYQYSKK